VRVVTVVGARPQFVKAAPLTRAFAAEPGIDSILLHTGQHFDDEMSDVFFQQLGIPEPMVNFGIGSGSHGSMTGRMIEAIEPVLVDLAPDWVVVLGDTNSTLAASVAASKLSTRLAHVEAGLRSFNRRMPEEINRVVADHLSHLCFAPTATACANLDAEGIAADAVVRSGDVMFDAVRLFGELAEQRSTIVEDLGLDSRSFVLATIHRAENTDVPARLDAVIRGLSRIGESRPVVLPLHPRTAGALKETSLPTHGLRIIDPVGYLDMLRLEANAELVVTDSGGVQKEAFFHGRPCVTLRDETEWVELVELGWNRIVEPTSGDAVATGIEAALRAGGGRPAAPYGDGDASAIIAAELARRSAS
jgi:UDP-GlcNAc3NAcA epimerase